MMNPDRRMLIVGHWGPQETRPSNQRVRALVERLGAILGPKGPHPFLSMSGQTDGPDVLYNPSAADVTHKLADEPENVSDKTLLFFYYIGHAIGVDDDDLFLRLQYKTTGKTVTRVKLSTVLEHISESGFRKLIIALDCCHAGRTISMYRKFPSDSLAMLATGNGYAFNCEFSEAIVHTLERPSVYRDQRIDRSKRGFTYQRLFSCALGAYLRKTKSNDGRPEMLDSGMGNELIADAPVRITTDYNEFVSRRTVYGRVFTCLVVISENRCLKLTFPEFVRQRREFMIEERSDEENRYITHERAIQYCNFLVESGLVVENNGALDVSASGRAALNGQYNEMVLDAIQRNILPADVAFSVLDETIASLIVDMIPPTPAMISERLVI